MEQDPHHIVNIILNFVPILLLFFLLMVPQQMKSFALTFLGKLVLVITIPIFAYLSIFLGLAYCVALIAFYHYYGGFNHV